MRSNPLVLADYRSYCEDIADRYDQLPEFNENEVWRWEVLINSAENFYAKMARKVDVVFVDGQPYDNAEQMRDKVERTGVLRVSRDYGEHPVWTVDENLRFRAVHDYIVHIMGGFDFSRRGEIGAYNLHRRLTPKDAIPALFTEVVGQACYANARGDFPTQKIAVFDDVDFYNVGKVGGRKVARTPRLPEREMVPRSNPHSTASELFLKELRTWLADQGRGRPADVVEDVSYLIDELDEVEIPSHVAVVVYRAGQDLAARFYLKGHRDDIEVDEEFELSPPWEGKGPFRAKVQSISFPVDQNNTEDIVRSLQKALVKLDFPEGYYRDNPDEPRRAAAFILERDVKLNRGLASKAIKSVIGNVRSYDPPHFFEYRSAKSDGAMSGDPVIQVSLTDDEFKRVINAARQLGAEFDAYHD